jgi:hypothetical protein
MCELASFVRTWSFVWIVVGCRFGGGSLVLPGFMLVVVFGLSSFFLL